LIEALSVRPTFLFILAFLSPLLYSRSISFSRLTSPFLWSHTIETRGAVCINMGSEAYSLGSIKNGTETRMQETPLQDGDFPLAGASVEAKYMGTITDQREMSMLGRVQVLRVRIPHNKPLDATY
jgi:hypothetical protein